MEFNTSQASRKRKRNLPNASTICTSSAIKRVSHDTDNPISSADVAPSISGTLCIDTAASCSRSSSESTSLSESSYLSSSTSDPDSDDSDDSGDSPENKRDANGKLADLASAVNGKRDLQKKNIRTEIQNFLPQLAAANAELDRRRDAGEIVDRGFKVLDDEQDSKTGHADGKEMRRKGRQAADLVREVRSQDGGSSSDAAVEEQAVSGAQEDTKSDTSQDSSGSEDDGQYVEMNLGLGVLEEQPDSSSTEDTSDDEAIAGPPSDLQRLLSIKRERPKSRKKTTGSIAEL